MTVNEQSTLIEKSTRRRIPHPYSRIHNAIVMISSYTHRMSLFRRLLPGFLFSVASLLALDGVSDLESARRLLASGRIDQAEKLTRRNIENGGDVAAAQAVLGDILF